VVLNITGGCYVFDWAFSQDLNNIKGHIAEVDAKTEKLFSRITDRDLRKSVRRLLPDGSEEVYELEQMLYQLPIVTIHHFGEIFEEFWKMNPEAPYYSYLTYSKDKTASKQQ